MSASQDRMKPFVWFDPHIILLVFVNMWNYIILVRYIVTKCIHGLTWSAEELVLQTQNWLMLLLQSQNSCSWEVTKTGIWYPLAYS